MVDEHIAVFLLFFLPDEFLYRLHHSKTFVLPKLQDSQLNEIPQYLVRPCVKSPTVARAARDFRYQDNTGTLSPVSLERANNDDRNS